MSEVASQGRTVIFVSHQLNQIRRLCSAFLWIEGGRLREAGRAPAIVARYEASAIKVRLSGIEIDKSAAGRFVAWRLVDHCAAETNLLTNSDNACVEFCLKLIRPVRNAVSGLALLRDGTLNMFGTAITGLNLEPGVHWLRYRFPHLPVQPGVYQWEVSLAEGHVMIDDWYGIPEMLVVTEVRTHHRDEHAGLLNLSYQFDLIVENGALPRS
jgi:teichoic acid transport system ATP-binding protein